MNMEKKLTDKDVRIIYLPPMTMASIHLIGNEPEERTAIYVNDFIKETCLNKIKPDFKHFGFNNPDNVSDSDPKHGYERWISVPDNIPINKPFVNKNFSGGTFAAHMIPWGLWDEGWMPLYKWVETNKKYEQDYGGLEFDGTAGWLEEHLNYIYWYDKYVRGDAMLQLDLLLPIKIRNG